jgi:hypothetical protein
MDFLYHDIPSKHQIPFSVVGPSGYVYQLQFPVSAGNLHIPVLFPE